MKNEEKEKPIFIRTLKSFAKEFLIPIVIALLVIQYVIQAFQIPSGSMEDTLLTGDFLLGLKFEYGSPIPFSDSKFPAIHDPKRGDIVIFRYPGEPEYPDYDAKRYIHLANALMFGNFYYDKNPINGNPHIVHYADGPKDFIKRCVGISGDTIEIKEGKLYSNNTLIDTLPGNGKYTATFRTNSPRDNLGPVYLPKPGDTIYFDSLSLVDLWRIRSLMIQENPKSKIELELSLFVNGKNEPNYIFENFIAKIEGDRNLILNEILSNRGTVGISLMQGDTISGPLPFAFFSNLTRTGFLPLIDPNKTFSGFTRPVSYMAFEGSQLQDLEDNILALNNANDSLKEDSLTAKKSYELKRNILIDGKEVSDYVVRAPVYFMMGDNRDNSADSRYFGFVASRNIKAKAFIIYFSFENKDQTFALNNPFTWWRIPFKIRYSRLGKLIHLIGE